MSKHSSKKKISLFGSQFSTIISVALVLLIIGFILIATYLTHGADDSIRRRVALVVRVTDDASDSQITSLEQMLRSADYVSSLHYSSAQDVYDEEMQYNAELLQALESNPYSSEFDIMLNHPYVNSDSINAIISRLTALPYVDTAYSSLEVVDNINFLLHKVTIFLSVFGIVMIIISIVLIFNTVNLVVYSRRFLIYTMKLVGAKSSFIRRPFLISGLRLGFISGLVASVVICALHFYATTAEIGHILLPTWIHTAILCGVLIIIGTLFCGIAAYLLSARFIHYSHDSLYKK